MKPPLFHSKEQSLVIAYDEITSLRSRVAELENDIAELEQNNGIKQDAIRAYARLTDSQQQRITELEQFKTRTLEKLNLIEPPTPCTE